MQFLLNVINVKQSVKNVTNPCEIKTVSAPTQGPAFSQCPSYESLFLYTS